MSTSFTEPIYEGQEITFEQFVWRCARGIDFLYALRDQGLNHPVPKRLEPNPYHMEHWTTACAELARFQSLTPDAADYAARLEYRSLLEAWEEGKREKDARTARYETMITRVEAWTPPTPQHQGLKDFMLRQLRESLAHDCVMWDPPVEVSGEVWLAQKIASTQSDIEYYHREYTKEVERVEDTNRWLAELRASVPQPQG